LWEWEEEGVHCAEDESGRKWMKVDVRKVKWAEVERAG
jgi:hypothetical protein